ncbi:hypothetical protein ACWQXT_25360 [Citrobacter werkmanii]|uniref:hypothetical protein n=1 Tax=Enterobacteriaceae TaxID=543 RepID=UPI000B8E5A17|nr:MULTISPECIES: hypothetical protein [Enterobacteriaceae]EMB9958140.1 hypothetical protein [Escherichia coli]MCX3173768.1 hypothetical protein [Escherichia coli]MYL95822.1 hypothetical protein [Citrobacter werkmanii]
MVGDRILLSSDGVARLYIFTAKQQSKYTMKHNPTIPAVDIAADEINIHDFLQQVVDHYPRLVVFSSATAP